MLMPMSACPPAAPPHSRLPIQYSDIEAAAKFSLQYTGRSLTEHTDTIKLRVRSTNSPPFFEIYFQDRRR